MSWVFCSGASAAEVSPDAVQEWYLLPFDYFDDYKVAGVFDATSGTYNAQGTGGVDSYLNFSCDVGSSGVFPRIEIGHTYLFYITVSLACAEQVDLIRLWIRPVWGEVGAALSLSQSLYNESSYVNSTSTITAVYTVTPSANNYNLSTASQAVLQLDKTVNHAGRVSWAVYCLDVSNTTADQVDAIVSAINNQTTSLQSSINAVGSAVVGAVQDQTDRLMDVPDEQKQAIAQAIQDTRQLVDDKLEAVDPSMQLSDALVNVFGSTAKYQFEFPGVSGPFMPDGSTVTIIPPQTVDMSYMDRFSVITDAIGVIMLGLCAWRTVDFIHRKIMLILGDEEADES